jgi:hypothetical protein
MTELEAKKRWCPMVRIVTVSNSPSHHVANHTSYNSCQIEEVEGGSFKPSGTTCIASGCMMWCIFVNTADGYCGLTNFRK